MKKDDGFTLIEVMVAMVLFLIILGGMLPVFLSFAKANTATEIRSEAMAAAAQVLDQLRLTDPIAMPASGTPAAQNITIGARTFSVTTTYCGNTTYCTTNNNRDIQVRVSYKNRQLYEVETVFTQLR